MDPGVAEVFKLFGFLFWAICLVLVSILLRCRLLSTIPIYIEDAKEILQQYEVVIISIKK